MEGYATAVSLGPENATWSKLYDALEQLARTSGGAFAFVLDEGNGLWCVGIPGEPATTATSGEDRCADRFYAREVHPHETDLRHGIVLDVAVTEGDDRYVAISFASIYVVVVWFERDFDPRLVRARIRKALPEIEAFTLALPPSPGPGTDTAAGKLRA